MRLVIKVLMPLLIVILLAGCAGFLYMGINEKNRFDHNDITLRSCAVNLTATERPDYYAVQYTVTWSDGRVTSCDRGTCVTNATLDSSQVCSLTCDPTIALYNCGFDSTPFGANRDAMIAGFALFAVCIVLALFFVVLYALLFKYEPTC